MNERLHALFSHYIYTPTVTITEGREAQGSYHGNGHHLAQEITEKVTEEFLRRMPELLHELVLPYVQATTILLNDRKPAFGAHIALLHARSFGDEGEVLDHAARLHLSENHPFILVNGSDGEGVEPGKQAWAGRQKWVEELTHRGVTLMGMFESPPALHTKAENDVFLEYCKEHQYQPAYVVTQPHQIVRTMLGFVRSMRDKNFWMNMYASVPLGIAWWQEAYGPQGEKKLTRFDHMWEELRRIPQYQAKGDLATFEELFDYLKKRDAGTLPQNQ